MATSGRETEDDAPAGREADDVATGGRETEEEEAIRDRATGGLPCFFKNDFDYENAVLLGSGGFGEVRLIKQISRNRMVAMKTSKKDMPVAPDIVNELKVLSKIRMCYIVEMLGVVYNRDQRMCGILLEHVANGSIDDVVMKIRRKLPSALQLRVMYQTAEAMKYLHEHKVLHLDLKTANILLNETCVAKVADFGLSRVRQYMSTRLCPSEADSKGLCGTEYFYAPETMRDPNRKLSRKCDVYAFAITMWQIITGKWPFSDVPHGMREHIRQLIMDQNRVDPFRPDIAEVPQVTPQEKKIVQIMKSCWHQDPKQRPHFAGESQL